jgi:hypothetical protein
MINLKKYERKTGLSKSQLVDLWKEAEEVSIAMFGHSNNDEYTIDAFEDLLKRKKYMEQANKPQSSIINFIESDQSVEDFLQEYETSTNMSIATDYAKITKKVVKDISQTPMKKKDTEDEKEENDDLLLGEAEEAQLMSEDIRPLLHQIEKVDTKFYTDLKMIEVYMKDGSLLLVKLNDEGDTINEISSPSVMGGLAVDLEKVLEDKDIPLIMSKQRK